MGVPLVRDYDFSYTAAKLCEQLTWGQPRIHGCQSGGNRSWMGEKKFCFKHFLYFTKMKLGHTYPFKFRKVDLSFRHT